MVRGKSNSGANLKKLKEGRIFDPKGGHKAWAYPGGGGTGGRLPLFEPREFLEILIITKCFFKSQPSQN